MSDSTSTMRSLTIQRRVLYALMMREVITRFGRNNLGALWLIGEPMIFTLGIVGLWTASGMNHGSSMPIVAFAVTGYSSVLLWRNCSNRALGAIEMNLPLLFHRNVKVLDVFLTRSVLEIAGATGSFVILSIFFMSIGWMEAPTDMLRVIFAWVLLAWFGTALGLLIGAGAAYSEIVEKLWGPVAYMLFPLSGAAVMVDWLPPAYQKIILLLPMVHGVEMLRDGYFGNSVRTHYDASYLAVCSLILTLAGLLIARNAGQKVQER